MWSKKIKKIELVFENTDGVVLLPSMFKHLKIQDISQSLYINCYQYERGEIDRHIICKYFYIEINEKGKKQLCWLEENKTLEERIEGNDITSIILTYDNEQEDQIYVIWNEDDEYTNKYQTNSFGSDNKLTIKICKD